MFRGITYIILISLFFSPLSVFAREGVVAIGEQDIIDRTIEAAPESQIAKEELGELEARYLGSKSVFDTNARARADYTRDEFARSSNFFGTRTDTSNWNIGLAKKMPFGTETALSWTNEKNQLFGVPSIQGQTIFPNYPTYESALMFSVSHPFMKNFGGLNDRSDVAAAKKVFSAADLGTKYRISTIARNALVTYWQWVISKAYMATWVQAVGDAQHFLNTTLERRKLGTVEDTDVLAARSQLFGKRNGLLNVRRLNQELEKNLKIILGYPEDMLLSSVDKAPRRIQNVITKKDEAILYALENRWDYKAQEENVKRQDIKLVSAKNKQWPSLDLMGTLAVNNITSSYAKTMSGVDNPKWTIGMNFSVPLENRAARAEYKQTRHEKTKSVIYLKKMENDIANEIAEYLRRINIESEIVANSEKQMKLNREKLIQEAGKYRIGRSNSEMIIIYQDDCQKSELAYYNSWANYIESLLNLKLAENRLIDL